MLDERLSDCGRDSSAMLSIQVRAVATWEGHHASSRSLGHCELLLSWNYLICLANNVNLWNREVPGHQIDGCLEAQSALLIELRQVLS